MQDFDQDAGGLGLDLIGHFFRFHDHQNLALREILHKLRLDRPKMASDQRKRVSEPLTCTNGHGYTSAPMAGSGRDGAWAGMGTGWAITATMIGGIAVWGSLGYLADRLLGITPRILTALGMVLGAGLGTYLVYLRYGKGDKDRGAP